MRYRYLVETDENTTGAFVLIEGRHAGYYGKNDGGFRAIALSDHEKVVDSRQAKLVVASDEVEARVRDFIRGMGIDLRGESFAVLDGEKAERVRGFLNELSDQAPSLSR